MTAPEFVQITTTRSTSGAEVLHALDKKGRVWRKFGKDPWKPVTAEAARA